MLDLHEQRRIIGQAMDIYFTALKPDTYPFVGGRIAHTLYKGQIGEVVFTLTFEPTMAAAVPD